MKVWSKNETIPGVLQAAQAANEGLSRAELLQKTLRALSADATADRIGAWLEFPEVGDGGPEVRNFRGMVWDRDGAELPGDWRQLSLQPPLPSELWHGASSVEQRLEQGVLPLIGPLMELRRAVWVPITRKGRLHGVLLAGSRSKHGELTRPLFEAAAAQLALALELDEEQQRGRQRQEDLAVVRRMLGKMAGMQPADSLLAELLEDCISAATNRPGLQAIFAAIGVLSSGDGGGSAANVNFRWKSGDPAWSNALETPPVAKIWRASLSARQTLQEQADMRWKHDRAVMVTAIPIEADGHSVGVFVAGVGPCRDAAGITERLELRASLVTSALLAWQREQDELIQVARRKALLDRGPHATVLLDHDGRIAAMSAAAETLSGTAAGGGRSAQPGSAVPLALPSSNHTAPSAPREPVREARTRLGQLFQASDEQRIDRWCKGVLASLDERRSEVRREPADAPEGVLQNGHKVRLRPALTVGGPYAAIVFENASDHPLSEKDSHSDRELRSLLEWLDEGVLLFDAHDNVRAVNSRFLQMTGLDGSSDEELQTLDHLIFKLSERVLGPGNFAQRWRNLARGIDGGIREELEFVRPYARIVQRMARPILDGAGRNIGRLEIYRDLSARREYQSTLLRTEKLAALGQLMTGVAHELNNPLTSILGYSQRLLQKERASAHGHERQLRQIFEEAQRATSILRQLLRNVHESKHELAAVALNQAILQTIELQQASMAQENVRVELNLDPCNPLVYADLGQLQQVLLNLTGNARQALEQAGSGGTIRVRTKQIGEQRVLLEIADSGPGIPREIIGRIFDPFFTTKPVGTGTGLGLAIVAGIVREHGGHINVASPPTGGAIFSIALRAVAGASRVEHFQKMNAASTGTSSHLFSRGTAGIVDSGSMLRSSFGGPLAAAGLLEHPGSSADLASRAASRRGSNRILVVEDEPTVARLIADVLEDEGFYVDVLLDGDEALRQAARETYDLAICDMKMPGIDGQHFYQALVQAGNSLSERFLFVTGDVVSPPTHNFMRLHGLPHVAKPFRMEELKEKVYSVLEKIAPSRAKAAEVRNGG